MTEAGHAGEPPGSDVVERRIARFERLYREQLAFVWGAARSLGVGDAAVPDVVQEVFITAYHRIDHLDPQVSPRAWLYTVARRVAFRVRRSAARGVRRESALRQLPQRNEPHAREEAAIDLACLLDELDDPQREAFVMADLLGMTGPEMADQIGVPLDTVYSRLRLARGRLQRVAQANTIERAIHHARRPPDPQQSRRSWAALLVALPRATAWLSAIGLGKLGLAGATVVLVIAAGIDRTPDAPVTPAAQRDDPPALAQQREPAPAATVPGGDAIAAAPTISAPPTMPASREAPPAIVRTPARTTVTAARPTPTAGIDAEIVALERASTCLDRHEAADALAIVDGDVARNAALADVRGSLRARALCELGRRDDARRELARLRAAHPDSHAVLKVRCDPS